jgi:hypothetical protein
MRGWQAAGGQALRSEMADYYRSVPLYYLKPLRAVIRKANAAVGAPVQLPLPEVRDQHPEDVSKGTAGGNAAPVVALPAGVKARLDQLRFEKAKVCGARAAGMPSFPRCLAPPPHSAEPSPLSHRPFPFLSMHVCVWERSGEEPVARPP